MAKKIKQKKKRGLKFICFIIFLLIFYLLYSFSNKMLIEIGVSSYSGMLSSASYSALDKALDENYNFGDYFEVEKNNDGDVTMILTNSYEFNMLSNKIAEEVANYFNQKLGEGIDVPIGVFTGIGLLSGFGKKVKMPLITVSSIKCDIVSTFQSAGINQTKHSLVINIIPEVYVVTRFSTKDLKDSISVLVYENIIVGNVPDTYLQGSIISAVKPIN